MSKINTLKPKIIRVDLRRGSHVATKRIRGYELTRIRKRIGLRDSYECQVCGRVTVKGEVDHIVPLHRGGAESDENRQWLCKSCHSLKSEREEKERG
jgi:5-methylcytosine-specific restriction endonuclease McrA